ncbi:MAG: efflux RND transporter periplasmic adaptor subunit [Elusimicrobia bacterium]|jgi:macrolide-specific efflux system membrane fusion protein|nr:efflux RND transporter periplasmic adaptor subunit [Elusimicrobiota bacterium]
MSKKKLITTILFTGILAGAWYWKSTKADGTRAQTQSTTLVTEGPIEESVDATGAIVPLNRIEIKPPMAGRIENLLVDEGSVLSKGKIMAWMSSSDRAAILDAARAQGTDVFKRWEDDYKATPIVAPLSGTVILRNVVVGQTVDSSSVLFAMSDTLIVLAQVDESDIGRVTIGMPARITLDAYPDVPVEGRVSDILYEGKNVSNVITYGVKVLPAEIPSFFRSQMTANVRFVVRRNPSAILVAASAVQIPAVGPPQVLVQGPEGKPIPRDIKTGIESGDKIEVLSGLIPGDQVFLTRGRYVPQRGPQSSPLAFGSQRKPKDNGATSSSPSKR